MSDAPGYLDFMGILPEEDFEWDFGRPVYCVDGYPVVEPGPLVDLYSVNHVFSYPYTDNSEILPAGATTSAIAVATTIVNNSDMEMTVVGRLAMSFAVKYNPAGSTAIRSWVGGFRQPMAASAGANKTNLQVLAQAQNGYGGWISTTHGAIALNKSTNWNYSTPLAFPTLHPGERFDVYGWFQFTGISSASHVIAGGSWSWWVAGVAGGI